MRAMPGLPHALYRPDQVAALDRYAIERLGVPGMQLMERAGRIAYEALRAAWPDRRELLVLCGSGNNGGDGYVVADLARLDGLSVDLIQMGDPDALNGDARTAAERFLAGGGRRRAFGGDLGVVAPVVVDALLGTGLQREVRADWAALIDAVNALGAPVLAVDIPSGLSGESGAVLGTAIRADLTTTFIGLKRGLFTGRGPALTGEILWSGLDLPEALFRQQPPSALRTDYLSVCHRLRPRERDAHKGAHGHVLILGGDHGMGGAALMSATGALRTGAGLVSVATRPAHVGAILGARPEVMALGIDAAANASPLLARASVIAVGPGLGRSEWGRGLLGAAAASGVPLVVDADALNLLAEDPRPMPQAVLTPHPGEAARLLGCSTTEVQRDRWGAALELQKRYQATVILKGAGTIIQAAGEIPRVCSDGNPGLATGGTGDVLTGICAGLLAQGHAPLQAAELAVCLHAAAGDRAAEQGERGMVATDLLAPLRRLVNPS